AVVYAIKELARQDFSLVAFALSLALGAVCLVAYLRGQQHRAHPLLDLSLFRLHDFGGAFAAACLGTARTVGLELVLSQHLELVEPPAPLAAALVLTPLAAGGFIGGPLAGRLMHRPWPAGLACAALALAAVCAWLLALSPPVQAGV